MQLVLLREVASTSKVSSRLAAWYRSKSTWNIIKRFKTGSPRSTCSTLWRHLDWGSPCNMPLVKVPKEKDQMLVLEKARYSFQRPQIKTLRLLRVRISRKMDGSRSESSMFFRTMMGRLLWLVNILALFHRYQIQMEPQRRAWAYKNFKILRLQLETSLCHLMLL